MIVGTIILRSGRALIKMAKFSPFPITNMIIAKARKRDLLRTSPVDFRPTFRYKKGIKSAKAEAINAQ